MYVNETYKNILANSNCFFCIFSEMVFNIIIHKSNHSSLTLTN